jgi:hypothetical protein
MTWKPFSANNVAQVEPAGPPPTTSTSQRIDAVSGLGVILAVISFISG